MILRIPEMQLKRNKKKIKNLDVIIKKLALENISSILFGMVFSL